MSDSEWQTGDRGGVEFRWRWCDCDEWTAGQATIEPGFRHVREQVPETSVELCYHADPTTHTITILVIRTVQ